MRFDEASLGNFAKRSSSKWRRFPDDVLPMHVAEMDFEVAEPIRARLFDMIDRSDLGYTGPTPEVANAFADYAKVIWSWSIDKSALRLATDVGVAAVEILRAVTEPGERVLVNSPVYSSFFKWIAEVGASVYDVPLLLEGSTWRLDLAGIEQAFASGTKVYLLCSPHNPVGRIHTADELKAVADLAHRFGVLVISDEIHAPLSFEQFFPYLSLGRASEATGVTITSSSKAWNTAGLKAAFYLTQADEVARRIQSVPEATHWRASILGAFAMAEAYSSGRDWMAQTVTRLERNHEVLLAELAGQLPEAVAFSHRATYLAWLDLSAYGIENPAQHILERGKVALVPGADHAAATSRYNQFVRLNFATSPERIAEAVRRMAHALAV